MDTSLKEHLRRRRTRLLRMFDEARTPDGLYDFTQCTDMPTGYSQKAAFEVVLAIEAEISRLEERLGQDDIER